MLVFKNQTCTAQKLLVRHRTPGMFFLADTSHIPCPFYQITTKGIGSKIRNLIDIVAAAFSGIEPVHFIRMVSDVYIRFMVSVVDSTVAATDVLRNRNADIKDVLSSCLVLNGCEIERRVHLVFVVDKGHKLLFDFIDLIIFDAENFSIVLHTEKNVAAVAVGKSADGLVDVLRDFSSQFFKFHGDVFAFIISLQIFQTYYTVYLPIRERLRHSCFGAVNAATLHRRPVS